MEERPECQIRGQGDGEEIERTKEGEAPMAGEGNEKGVRPGGPVGKCLKEEGVNCCLANSPHVPGRVTV